MKQIKRQTPKSKPATSDDDEEFETADLYLASFLVSRGVDMVDTYFEGNRMQFVFSDPDRCEAEELRFGTGRDEPVKASDYARTVKALKNLAMAGR